MIATHQDTDMDTGNDTTPLLELVDISVHYGAVIGLDKVSLAVNQGELVAVMGPNGAGKSTVLKAIMGLAPVVGGMVYLRGTPLDVATHEIVKQGISFVPQGRRVFTHLTIEENLKMGCMHINNRDEQEQRLEATPRPLPDPQNQTP